MKILLFAIFILWLIKISRDILFWVYVWQLKEYRLDRMRAHFELPSAKKIFFNKLHLIKIILLLSSLLLFIDIWGFFFPVAVSILYIALGARSAYAVYAKNLKEPLFTRKAVALCGGSVALLVVLSFLFFYKAPASAFLAALLGLDLAVPLIVAGIAGLSKYPSDFFKLKTMERAAARRAGLKDLLVIGITGSYGKTTMKELLAHILSGKLKVAKTPENKNSEIGVALYVLNELPQDSDVFIAEMGAYKEGEIKKICEITKPQIGILTGINEQHISLFGSLEQIIRAKYELIESLPKTGLAVFNGENDYTRALYEKTRIPKRMYSFRTFSVSSKPDIAAEKIDSTKGGMKFYVRLGNKKEFFETKLLGRHNVLNILGASLAAYDLGMSLEQIGERIKSFEAPAHTLNIKPGINGSMVIDDSYSANPRGVMAALDVLDNLRGGKKFLVMYPLIELGKTAPHVHRRIGIKVNKVCDVAILTSPDFSREIRKNAPNTDVFLIRDPQVAIEKLTKDLKAGDIVLLENRVPEEIKAAIIATNV